MTMRDKIASTISKNITLEDGVFVGGFFDAADAIMHSLPELIPHYEAQQKRLTVLENALVKILCEAGKCNGKNRYKITDIASLALVVKT
jgi:hypothetical protein